MAHIKHMLIEYDCFVLQCQTFVSVIPALGTISGDDKLLKSEELRVWQLKGRPLLEMGSWTYNIFSCHCLNCVTYFLHIQK